MKSEKWKNENKKNQIKHRDPQYWRQPLVFLFVFCFSVLLSFFTPSFNGKQSRFDWSKYDCATLSFFTYLTSYLNLQCQKVRIGDAYLGLTKSKDFEINVVRSSKVSQKLSSNLTGRKELTNGRAENHYGPSRNLNKLYFFLNRHYF